MANAVQFHRASVGTRRLVETRPAGRPALRSPQARPSRALTPGRVGVATSCAAVARPAKASRWLSVKVAAVALIAVVGASVSAQEFIAMAEPNPSAEFVAGDPAWAHVNP